MGIDNDAFLLILRLILRLVAKKAKSMVTLSFNEVKEAIEGDDVRLLEARKSDVEKVASPRISFNSPNYSGHQR